MAINPRHDTQIIDLSKGIDGDSKLVSSRSGYATDLENIRVTGGVLEKRNGYSAIASFPIEARTSTNLLTYKEYYYDTVGYVCEPATETNVRDMLGINSTSFTGYYLLQTNEELPQDTTYLSGVTFSKLNRNTFLIDSEFTAFDVSVETGPSLPTLTLSNYVTYSEGGFLVIEDESLSVLVAGTKIRFALNYFGTINATVTEITGDRAVFSIAYAAIPSLPVLELFYILPNTPLYLQYHTSSYAHVTVSGVAGRNVLTLNVAVQTADCSCFGIIDKGAFTHFIHQYEGKIVAGHNNRFYILDPNESTLFKLPAYNTTNSSNQVYSADSTFHINVPTSTLPTSKLFVGCDMRFKVGNSEYSGTVIEIGSTVKIKINQAYWEIPVSTRIVVTYTTTIPHIADVKIGDCFKIGEEFYQVTTALPYITLNKEVTVTTDTDIFFIARMRIHDYSKTRTINPLWYYGVEAPFTVTTFSQGLYVSGIEGGILRYDGRDITNLSDFKAPTLPLVRSILGTHGSLEVQADATMKDGYANEQQIVITYVIEEWTGSRLESMPTPHYDCITRPALNPDGSMYASWLELAVPTLPAGVTTCSSIKIRVYRRDYVYSESTILELEVEVDCDMTKPYQRIIIGNKFNFSGGIRKQLYADLFRFSHLAAPRASGIASFGNSLFAYNTLTEPRIEIIANKVFDFETRQGANFIGFFRFQTPDFNYRTIKLGKDTTTTSYSYVAKLSSLGSYTRTLTKIACYVPLVILIGTNPFMVFFTGDKILIRYTGTPYSELEPILSNPLIVDASTTATSLVCSASTRFKGVMPAEFSTGTLTGFVPFKLSYEIGEQLLAATREGVRIYVSEGKLMMAVEEHSGLNPYLSTGVSGRRWCITFANEKDDTFGNIRKQGSNEVLSWSRDLIFFTDGSINGTLYLEGFKYNLFNIFILDNQLNLIPNYVASEVAHTSTTNSHGPFNMYMTQLTTSQLNLFIPSNTVRENVIVDVSSTTNIYVGDYVSLAWSSSGQLVSPESVNLPEGFPSLRGSFKVLAVNPGKVTLDVVQVPDTVPIPFKGEITVPFQGLTCNLIKPSEIMSKTTGTTLRVNMVESYNADYNNRIAFMIVRNAEYDSVDMQLSGYFRVKGGSGTYIDLEYPDTIDLSTLNGFIYGRLLIPREANTLAIPVPVKNDITERLTDLAFPMFSLRPDEAYTGISILSRLAYALNSWEHSKYVVYYGSTIAGGTSPYPAVGIQIQYRGYPISRDSSSSYSAGTFPILYMTETSSSAYTIFSSIGGAISSQPVAGFGFSAFSLMESSRLWWTEKSKEVDRESFIPLFNNLNYQDIFSNEADTVVAIAPLKESGLVFKEKSIYSLALLPNQQGTITISLKRMEAPTGSVQPFNLASASNSVYYISAGSGLYVCDGEKSTPLPMNEYFDRDSSVNSPYAQYAFSDPFEEVIYLGYTNKEGNIKRFCLDYSAGSLTTDKLPEIPRGYVKFESSHLMATDSSIWISSGGYDDNGEPIAVKVVTPFISPDPIKHSFVRSIVSHTYSDIEYTYDQKVYYSYGQTGEAMIQQRIPIMQAGRQEFGGVLLQYQRQGSVLPRNTSVRIELTESSSNVFQVHSLGVVFQVGNTSRIKQQGVIR